LRNQSKDLGCEHGCRQITSEIVEQMDGYYYIGGKEEWLDVARPLDFVSGHNFNEATFCIPIEFHAIWQNLGLRSNLFLTYFGIC